jgi:hypothetical protein
MCVATAPTTTRRCAHAPSAGGCGIHPRTWSCSHSRPPRATCTGPGHRAATRRASGLGHTACCPRGPQRSCTSRSGFEPPPRSWQSTGSSPLSPTRTPGTAHRAHVSTQQSMEAHGAQHAGERQHSRVVFEVTQGGGKRCQRSKVRGWAREGGGVRWSTLRAPAAHHSPRRRTPWH